MSVSLIMAIVKANHFPGYLERRHWFMCYANEWLSQVGRHAGRPLRESPTERRFDIEHIGRRGNPMWLPATQTPHPFGAVSGSSITARPSTRSIQVTIGLCVVRD